MTEFRRRSVWLLLALLLFSGCDRMDLSGDTRQAVDAHLARAKKLYEQRDYTGAIAAYEEILRIDPGHPDALFKIALIYDRNLNDFLNAAYHYQRFLQSPNPLPGNVDLARTSLENVKLQFAAAIPNAGGQGTPELVKLRSENAALHGQVEELKREIVRVRGKPPDPPRGVETAHETASPSLGAKADPPRSSHPKTYIVKKGEGIQAIAEKVYGDRTKWREIVAANPKIKNPNQLKPGQVLVLP